jgi:hypothetical protein
MRKAIVVATLVGFSAVIGGVGTAWVAAATGETPLAPGATVFPADVSGAAAGTLLATTAQPFSYTTIVGTNSGTIESAVYNNGGTRDFYIQVENDSTSATSLAVASMTNFQGASTSVGYRTDGSTLTGTSFVDGGVPPITASRNAAPGAQVTWAFNPPSSAELQPGETSDVMVVATDATNYTAGIVGVGDGGLTTVGGFEPAPDTDLALTNVPAPITANATSSSGAVVTYTLPTVKDEDSPVPTVSCTPASGSTFAIGPTTVTCTVSDSDDSNSPVSAGFTVTVNAQPSVSTTVNLSTGPTGSTLQDSATLANTGTLDGTGSITFKLYRPGDTNCASPIHTETVTSISSDGPFATTTGYVTTAPGTYNWTASFSGDSNNGAASTTCGAEPVVITGISQITSTSATCSQFARSSASTIAQIKYSSKNGKIKSASPGGFDYWLTLTANGGSQSFTVTQLSNETSRPFLLAPGSSAYSTSCGAVPITITTQGNGAVVTFVVPASTSGLTYYVGLDFSTGNVVGEANPKPKSTVKYQFITGGVLGSTRDLTLAKSD